MCVTNVFVDRYPDEKEATFCQTTYCVDSRSRQPCARLSTKEYPVRNIQYGEPTTEYIMTTPRSERTYNERNAIYAADYGSDLTDGGRDASKHGRSHFSEREYHASDDHDPGIDTRTGPISQDPWNALVDRPRMRNVGVSPRHSLENEYIGQSSTPHRGTKEQISQTPDNGTQCGHSGSIQDEGKGNSRDIPSVPAESSPRHHLIKGTRGDVEKLDKSYAMRHTDYKTFFRPGRVFSTFWTEAHNDGNQSEHDQFQSITYATYNQIIYSKIRRFVVVRQTGRCCTCLPMTTYNGKGYKMRGIRLSEHGLIYSGVKAPDPVVGITKQALRIIPSRGAAAMSSPSYINYGRVYSVEMNVNVRDVGDLDPQSRRLLRTYFKDVNIRDFDVDVEDDTSAMSSRERTAELMGVGAGMTTSTDLPLHDRGYFDDRASAKSYPPRFQYYHDDDDSAISKSRHEMGTENDTIPSSFSEEGERQQGSHRETAHGPSLSQSAVSDLEDINLASLGNGIDDMKPGYGLATSQAENRHVPGLSDEHPRHSTSAREFSDIPDPYIAKLTPSDAPPRRGYIEKDKGWERLVINSPSHVTSSDGQHPTRVLLDGAEAREQALSVDISKWRTGLSQKDQGEQHNLLAETNHKTAIPKSSTTEENMPSRLIDSSTQNQNAIPKTSDGSDSLTKKDVARQHMDPSVRGKLSRSSSLDSILSIGFSIISSSSVSSVGNEQFSLERLVALFSDDEELEALLSEAMQAVGPRKLEDNIRRALQQCSAHLRDEVNSPIGVKCARALKRYSRKAATLVRAKFEAVGSTEDEVTDTEEEVNARHKRDASEDEGSDVEEWDDTRDAEELLVRSEAFCLLKENLRLFLHPNAIKRALFQVWPVTQRRHLPMLVRHRVDFRLCEYMDTCFIEGQELGRILTISGGAINAQAESCEDYLTATFPECGGLLLDMLQGYLRSHSAGSQSARREHSLATSDFAAAVRNDHATIQLIVQASPETYPDMSVLVTASRDMQEQVASALSWLTATLRPSSYQQLVYSSTSVNVEITQDCMRTIVMRPKDLEPVSETACWHPLFPHAVVAKNFPIRPRVEGKGLEISFANMALLGQTLSMKEFQGGLVMDGLRSYLIPTRYISDDAAVQWHMEYKRIGKVRKRHLLEIMKNMSWYKTLVPEELLQSRCFLGWAEDAAVMIGTESFASVRIKCSGINYEQVTGHVKSHSVTMGTEGLGFFGVSGTRSYLPFSTPSKFTLQHNKDILDTLDDAFDSSILAYDTGTKTAWLLPQADVVLYLAHAIIRRRNYQLSCGGQPASLGFATYDVEASGVIRQSLDFKFTRHSPSTQKTGLELSSTFKRIWNMLDMIEDELVSSEQAFETASKCAPQYLHGIEFQGVEKMDSFMRIKQVKVDQSWVHLTRSHPIVLFGKNIRQPIASSSPAALCRSWSRVPSGRDYLVATGSTIGHLLERHDEGDDGSRLDERVEWRRQDLLVQTHKHCRTSTVIHEQYLHTVKDARLDKGVYEAVKVHDKACFIFTSHRSPKTCTEKLVNIKYRAPRHETNPEYVVKGPAALPDVPEGSSDTSVESEFRSNLAQLSSSTFSSSSASQGYQEDREGLEDSQNQVDGEYLEDREDQEEQEDQGDRADQEEQEEQEEEDEQEEQEERQDICPVPSLLPHSVLACTNLDYAVDSSPTMTSTNSSQTISCTSTRMLRRKVGSIHLNAREPGVREEGRIAESFKSRWKGKGREEDG